MKIAIPIMMMMMTMLLMEDGNTGDAEDCIHAD